MNFNMGEKTCVSARSFSAIQRVSEDELSKLSDQEIRPLLACLVRMSLIKPLDTSTEWEISRKIILRLLSGIEVVNALVALLSIDFHALEVDVKKEQQLRSKNGREVQNGLDLDFERSDSARRLRLLISEILSLIQQTKDNVDTNYYIRPSEIFDNDIFLEEVADVLCIAQAELPALLPAAEVAEALLHVKNGPWLISRMLANIPDSFRDVCMTLISNGERQDEETAGGRIRLHTLRLLCQMNPSQALAIRAKCVECCRMPGLAIALTLDQCKQEAGSLALLDDDDVMLVDLVSFIMGLLLGSDPNVRTWFSQFVRTGQKRKEGSVLYALREQLLQRLQNLVLFSIDQQNLPDAKVVQASVLLRLYTALKGIAGLKFSEDETNLLLQLLTSHPPASPAGVRFVSLGLSMLIACSLLMGSPELERRGIEWIKWLLKEEEYFTSESGVCASYGEMLLLIAIHFHSNQVNAIIDLISATLGMKMPIRSPNLAHIKTIFTQEIFTEQVVTAHAVKVPVTPNLNANIPGFLPVHCIHQLLRSRAFTKHRVPIKDWIYRQVCQATAPIHPILPPLIEVYVNSIIVPSTRGSNDSTNEPISEEEIYEVFKDSVFAVYATGHKESRPSSASLTKQLLVLYYLLLYEDVRLTNMKSVVVSMRNVKRYSPNFLAELPMKYLLQQAHNQQHHYIGLFSSLLRLLTTHYPHLSLVEDWMYDVTLSLNPILRVPPRKNPITKTELEEALRASCTNPGRAVLILQQLQALPPRQLWPLAETFVAQFGFLLLSDTPRQILEMCKETWFNLNTIFPGRLWALTVNALKARNSDNGAIKAQPPTQDDITLDPLHVLRCHKKVFRCAPMLEIVLHMLKAFMAASSSQLSRHLLDNPIIEKTGNISNDSEREELKIALILAQESAAVQILLESCLPYENEKNEGQLSDLREVQTLICSHLHQVFIADPTLVKLVHFQGYPSSIIPIAVSGIPSMHICLDFIPELLSQPDLEKQVFPIHLISHLCMQYTLPKTISIARLAVSALSTLLGVVSKEVRLELFRETLPSLVRICRALPPLCDDIISLLQQLGKICMGQNCMEWSHNSQISDVLGVSEEGDDNLDLVDLDLQLSDNDKLLKLVRKTFKMICRMAVVDKKIY